MLCNIPSSIKKSPFFHCRQDKSNPTQCSNLLVKKFRCLFQWWGSKLGPLGGCGRFFLSRGRELCTRC